MVCEWHVKYAAGLTRGLADAGCDARLLSRTHDLEFGGEAGAAEAGTMARWVAATLDGRARHMTLPGRVRDAGALPHAIRQRRAVRAFAPDVVHLQDTVVHDLRLAGIAGIRPGRYALTVHDAESHPGDPARGARIRTSYRTLIRHAGLVFVHSESVRDRLLAREQPRGPVVVVPHGVDPPASQPLPDEPRVLFFGRRSLYKGLASLVEAMTLLWQRTPSATLVIAGHGPLPEHRGLQDDRVMVRDYVPEQELPALFRGARCVVLPYLEASQSGVGAQAKQFGRPLVVTDVGGLPDLVADGSGRLVPPGAPHALADALHEVLTAPGLAEEMGRAASAYAHENSWERVAHLTVEAYDQHLSGHPRSQRR